MSTVTLGPLVDGDATLRMIARDDLPTTLAWRNHPDSRVWFHSTAAIDASDHVAWFERYLERADDHVFVLELAGSPVAQVALYDIADGHAEFGRLLVDPGARGRGLSHRATAMCLRVADELLHLDEVHLEVKAENTRAIRTYERAGFVVDGSTDGTRGAIVMRRSGR